MSCWPCPRSSGTSMSRSISRNLAFAIFVGATSLHGHLAAAFTTGLPYPAELHTDGALPPFSRASSPQKLASPTFQVPFWYTARPD